MILKRCTSCLGAKELLGFGMMEYVKCKSCNGQGAIPDLEREDYDDLLAVTELPVAKVEPAVEIPVAKVEPKAKVPAKKRK